MPEGGGLRLLVAGVGGLIGTAVLVGLSLLWDGTTEEPLVLGPDQLRCLRGSCTVTPEGLRIRTQGAGEMAILMASPSDVRAETYGGIAWEAQDLASHRALNLVWISDRIPDRVQRLPLNREQRRRRYVDLRSQAAWQGRIRGIGLEIFGAGPPIRFRGIRLLPRERDLLTRWAQRFQSWYTHTPWDRRAINFNEVSSSRIIGSPLVQTALWIFLSGMLFVGLGSRNRRPAALGILMVLGWLALDIRWQWQLGNRLEYGLRRDVPGVPDGDLMPFVERIRARLPQKPIRLIILSGNPQAYLPQRMRYHLLPHNGYSGSIALLSSARAGDYLLVLDSAGISYDRRRKRLIGGPHRVSVTRLVRFPDVMTLYRVDPSE